MGLVWGRAAPFRPPEAKGGHSTHDWLTTSKKKEQGRLKVPEHPSTRPVPIP